MFAALFYLQFQTVKNRLWQRILRLRNPRYLIGAVAGGFYLVMMFGRTFLAFGGNGTRPTLGQAFGLTTISLELLCAFALFLALLLIWLIPQERAALVFSEPEIAFLFPAPVRRQTLIHYKLLRSQIGVLFTVLFLTLISRPSGGWAGGLMRAAGWWVLLSTVNLHLLGSSFARTMLLERGITPLKRRALVLAVAGIVLTGAMLWAGREIPAPNEKNIESATAVSHYLETIAATAPAVVLLAPFRWVIRPFLWSNNAQAFAWSIGPALGVLIAHYLWVIRGDVAFEEASIEASQRHATRTAAQREGRWQNFRPARRRRDPFRLSPTGPVAVAILWKNLLSAGQMFSPRVGLVMLIWAVAMGSGLGFGASQTAWPQVVGMVAGMLAVFTVVLGPQFTRQDFRQDLAAADLLKMYPVRGWQMALGELLAPALILTVVEWVLILLSAALLIGGQGEGWSDHSSGYGFTHTSLAISAAILVAPLNLVSLLIPNAAALLLPAWFAGPAAGGAARGIEVMGQRLIFLLAQFLALVVAVLPALLAGFLVYTLVALPYLPGAAAMPITAVMAAFVFLAEAASGMALLGHWFETYDLSSEKPA